MKNIAQLLRLTLNRRKASFTDKEAEMLIEIAMLEASGDNLLEFKVKEFKSQYVIQDDEWLDYKENIREHLNMFMEWANKSGGTSVSGMSPRDVEYFFAYLSKLNKEV